MNAIKKVRKYLVTHPDTDSARILGTLVEALGDERPFPLGDLYRLDFDTFELALALLEDWRLDRYYASRLKLFDVAHVTSRLVGDMEMKSGDSAPAPNS
jgi:hypothetical protein